MSALRTQTPQTFTPSKSTVLAGAGVQDAYWSDDEDDDADCPLCMEEMDVAEKMSFKPCPCGYQICMFCYHHIKNNLNGRCPACRREYLEENVQYTAVSKEDLKRHNQQKRRKERERRELEALNRKQFANARVVQRNVVYVVGLGPRLAKEELIPTLRSNEYFGQYGKISKMIIVKRNQPGSKTPTLGLYITYHRREDATRAINAVDGSPSPGGGGEVMRASYGTTKYCMSFLRGLSCSSPGCLDLHEWGDQNDCFTKEDLTTLKHSLKDSENHLKSATRKKGDELEGLPLHTSLPQKPTLSSTASTSRSTRTSGTRSRNPPLPRGSDSSSRPSHRGHDRRIPVQVATSSVTPSKVAGKIPSQSGSRPTTPLIQTSTTNGRPSSPPMQAVARARVQESMPVRSSTPASTVTADSDVGSSNIDADGQLSSPSIQSVPAAPPGLPPPSYQISTQAQALLDDVRARRDNVVQQAISSPFPEFDRTLDNLGGGDFHFQWSLDSKLVSSSSNSSSQLYRGPFDPFSRLVSKSNHEQEARQFPAPPGLLPVHTLTQSPSGYQGPFNPFADSEDFSVQQTHVDQVDGMRQESRFGFARRRTSPSVPQSSAGLSSASSPVTGPSTQYQSMDNSWILPKAHTTPFNPPTYIAAHDYHYRGMGGLPNNLPTPSASFHEQQAGMFPPGLRFRPFDNLDNDRSIANSYPAEPSTDPASQASMFMSTSLLSELHSSSRPNFSTAPGVPPGLSPRESTPGSVLSPIYSEQIQYQPTRTSLSLSHRGSSATSTSTHESPGLSPAPMSTKPTQTDTVLVAADFPALPVSSAVDQQSKREQTQPYIHPPLKPPEPKISGQPLIAKKVKPVKDSKTATTATPETQSKVTETIKSPPSITQQSNASTPLAKKTKRKQEKKEESRPPPYEHERPAAKLTIPKTAQPPPLFEPVHEPLFSKVSRKAKPIQPKVVKPYKEAKDEGSSIKAQREEVVPETSLSPTVQKQVVSEISFTEAPTFSAVAYEQTSLRDLMDQLHRKGFELSSHPFFDVRVVEGDPQTPLQYDPLVHALSALSVGGGSFANNLPTVSIDSAVSSFQQLLETLTQTISDLLRLLPRTTWDDSSSFDGVLRDMLKGDDFLDDTADDESGDDEVAALTLALERRARWMEVQLAKLEELHRDINTAAVRAVLAFNDKGWDPAGFMPHTGKALLDFDNIGVTFGNEDKSTRRMSLEELQRSLEKARVEEKATKEALIESMSKFKDLLPDE